MRLTLDIPVNQRLPLLDWLAGLSRVAQLPAERSYTYVPEATEQFASPEVFMATKRGDCDDAVTLFKSFLNGQGIASKIVGVRDNGRPHVVLFVPDRNLTLDPTYYLFGNLVKRPWFLPGHPIKHFQEILEE